MLRSILKSRPKVLKRSMCMSFFCQMPTTKASSGGVSKRCRCTEQ